MRLTLVTPPDVEPIELATAKLHLRAEGSNEEAAISLAITRARIEAEGRTGRALINQTWRLSLDCFPASGEIEIPKAPLSSVSSVKYIDENGTLQTFGTSNYVVDTSGERGRVYLAYDASWPSIRVEPNAVRVEFVAGYGDEAADVPATLRAWLLTRIGDHYAHREGTITGTIATQLPFVDSLLTLDALVY